MALRNGLLVHGPTSWAAAVRTSGGELNVATGTKPSFGGEAVARIPGVRGVTRLAEAFAVIPIVKLNLPQARLPMQDMRVVAAATGASLAARLLRRPGRGGGLVREGSVAVLSLAPALLALRSGELAAWHGVEHKSIAAYEQDSDAAEEAKEHDRCGSNLVAPLLASTVAGNIAARRVGLSGPLVDGAIALGSVGVAIEIFGWSERHADTALARALRRPGHEIQRAVGTREPSEDQLAVGAAAIAALLAAEEEAAQR